MIVEIAGKPPEHLKEKLGTHIMTLNKLGDVEAHNIKISEPAEIKDSDGIFTCFAEAEFSVPNLMRLTEIVFDFFPSSVEIIEPSTVNFSNLDATTLLNNIAGKIHRYDEFARIARIQMKKMDDEIKRLNEAPKKVETNGVKKVKKKNVKKVKKKK